MRSTDGRLWGKPTNGVEGKYLLTGLMQCAVCGGGVYVASRSHGRRRAYFYACTSFHRKGRAVCANNQQIVMEDADWAVMEVLQDELLDPVVVAEALRLSTSTLLDSPDAAAARLEALDARAREITTSIDRWTEAIAAGGELPSLLARLKSCEVDRRRVDQERRELEAFTNAGRLDVRTLERDLMKRVDEWRTAASRNVAQGRQVLRKLLRERVRMTPREDGQCALSGGPDYSKLFSGIVVATVVTSPTGSVVSYLATFSGLWRSHRCA